MGQRKRDSFLLSVTNPIVRWVQNAGHETHLTPRLSKASEKGSSSEIELTSGDRTWLFYEAWWAESFDAPAFDPMVGWVFWRFLLQIASLLRTTLIYTLIPALFGVVLALVSLYSVAIMLFGFLFYLPLIFPSTFLVIWLRGGIRSLRSSEAIPTANPRVALKTAWRKAVLLSNPFRHQEAIWQPLLERLEGKSKTGFWYRYVRRWSDKGNSPQETFFRVAERAFSRARADELALLRAMKQETATSKVVKIFLLLTLTIFYHALTAIYLTVFYFVALLLFSVLMAAVWLLSLISAVPGVPRVINAAKRPLDTFLVGSLGDIRVFLDDPVQGELIRDPLQRLLLKCHSDPQCSAIHVVAHSTGAAVAYETLALEYNREISSKVKTFATAGSILNMVWRRPHRPSFDRPLRDDIKWINFWTKYDPALAGPTEKARQSGAFDERQVTNNDSLVGDHTSYWDNYRQVVAPLVGELWKGGDTNPFARTEEDDHAQTTIRKRRVLGLTLPRLLAWYSPLIVIYLGYGAAMGIAEALRLGALATAVQLPALAERIAPACPTAADRWITIALAAGAVAALGLLLQKLYKDLVWDYFVAKRGLGV